jgi:hypothetical protein
MALLLRIAKNSYEIKLSAVEGAIGELENVRGEYNSLIGQLDSDVIDRSSSDFQAVEDSVKENLALIENSIKNAQNAREALSYSLQQYDELNANIRNTASTALETAKSVGQAAKDVLSLTT